MHKLKLVRYAILSKVTVYPEGPDGYIDYGNGETFSAEVTASKSIANVAKATVAELEKQADAWNVEIRELRFESMTTIGSVTAHVTDPNGVNSVVIVNLTRTILHDVQWGAQLTAVFAIPQVEEKS